jgi:Ca2+-dependent lipid-binding protein
MRLNTIMFNQNGGNGYRLKPIFMRDPTIAVDLNQLSLPQYKFKLTIISGEALPKPKQREKGEVVDPFVKIRVMGGNENDKILQYDTQTIWDNGFNPVWNETFEFSIYCIDMAYLRVTVYDRNKRTKNQFLCENIIPLNEIRAGYRNIPLKSKLGTIEPMASILVKTSFLRYTSTSSYA